MYSSKSLKIILILNVKQEKRHFEPPAQPPPPSVFSGVRVTRSLVLHVCVVNRFALSLSPIMLSVLRFKDSDHPFGIFILFLLSYFCK